MGDLLVMMLNKRSWLNGDVSHLLNSAATVQRLNLLRLSGERSHEASNAVLELTVLGGVEERVDAAVGNHQHHGEMVEPAEKRVKVVDG